MEKIYTVKGSRVITYKCVMYGHSMKGKIKI